jgi:hypothetical protein
VQASENPAISESAEFSQLITRDAYLHLWRVIAGKPKIAW